MRRRMLLQKTMEKAKTGDPESFENFYILTVQDTYSRIFALIPEKERAEEILTRVYTALYHEVHTMPLEEEGMMERIDQEIAVQTASEHTEKPVPDMKNVPLDETRAGTLWFRIEEMTGIAGEEKEKERSRFGNFLYSAGKIALTAAVLAVTCGGLYLGWNYFSSLRKETAEKPQETAVIKESKEVIIDREKLKSGWREENGSLFYVKHDGTPADGPLNLGRQLLSFSRKGELLMIGSNHLVTENGRLSFDEDIRYELRDGDVYRQDPETREQECVIRNGHVVQADVRCGYIWYISKYQTPNSEQIRTSLCRALPDGTMEKEIYSTVGVLETGEFQVSGQWFYYLSDGNLFRRDLATEETELLASDVKYYFAYDDTAYYVKDRALETVSHGTEYSGLRAGVLVEMNEDGLYMLKLLDGKASRMGDGEVEVGDRIYTLTDSRIRSVKPAMRRSGDVIYYIEESGDERKIFWENSFGGRGMVPQEGLSADCMCIAGDFLYYSARVSQDGKQRKSRIYRINLDSMELEEVGNPFDGQMKNLYYFENNQSIYGEYIPSAADDGTIHGRIVRLEDSGIRTISDAAVRPESLESDMLELVMADGSVIYCFYHRYEYNETTGRLIWTSTEPLKIETAP